MLCHGKAYHRALSSSNVMSLVATMKFEYDYPGSLGREQQQLNVKNTRMKSAQAALLFIIVLKLQHCRNSAILDDNALCFT